MTFFKLWNFPQAPTALASEWRAKNSAVRRRLKHVRVASFGAAVAVLLTTSGGRTEVSPGDVWSLFSELNLKFLSRLGVPAELGAAAGWALKMIGNEINSGSSISPNSKVLSQLQKVHDRLDKLDQQVSGINKQIEKTKEEVKREIDVAQFNIISAQLREPVARIQRLSTEYKDKWVNKDWLKNKPADLLKIQKAEFERQITSEVPQAALTIHSVLVSGGGSPGLLQLWTKKTSFDLPSADEGVTGEWLHRAGLIFDYYAAVQLKALALEAEWYKSYSTDSYSADDDVKLLEQAYKQRLLEQINFLPYGEKWGESWTDHLPDKTDIFVDTNTGLVWTTAKAITGEQKTWLGWPDGNNIYSAPTLEPMQNWLAQNKLVLPTIEEFAQAFRAFKPRASWPKKQSGDLGEFIAWYLGDAFTYTRESYIDYSFNEPLVPCIWIDTPNGVQSKIMTSVSRSVPIYENNRWTSMNSSLKADDLKRLEAPIRVRDPANPNDFSWYKRRPERECTVIAFRNEKIDGTPARAK